MNEKQSEQQESKSIPSFPNSELPIVGCCLPVGPAKENNNVQDSPEKEWTYFSAAISLCYREIGCNMAQSRLDNSHTYPPRDTSYNKYKVEEANVVSSLDNLKAPGNSGENIYLLCRVGNGKAKDALKWAKISDETKNGPGVYGMFLADEPGITGEKSFANVNLNKAAALPEGSGKPAFVVLHSSAAQVSQLFRDEYINKKDIIDENDEELTPEQKALIKNNEILGYKYYQTYLNRFQLDCNPDIWSADYYCFKGDSENNTVRIPENKRRYFENLLQIRNASVMTGKPFWWYIRTSAVNPEDPEEELEDAKYLLTETVFRFYAITGLMFGAQGLVEWRLTVNNEQLAAPLETSLEKEEGEEKEEVENRYVDVEGGYLVKVKGYFPALKKVNSEIRDCQHVFVNSSVTDIRFSPSESTQFANIYGAERSVFDYLAPYSVTFEPVSALESTLPLLLSRVKNGNKTYIVVASMDYKNKITEVLEQSQKPVKITFSKVVKPVYQSGGATINETPAKEHYLALTATNYVIFDVS